MNRRNLLKGLAALPLAGAGKGFASICSSTCHSSPNFLQVVLQGPFAVVINNTTGNIRAFTPKGSGDHRFGFNGKPYPVKKYTFNLQLSGWPSPPPSLCVQNKFPQFCAENTQFDFTDAQDHFITIDLPGPNNIIVLDSPYKADMQDGTNAVAVPGDHILQYNVQRNAVTMMATYDNKTVTLQPPANFTFQLEVGLENSLGGEADPDGSLATGFYNNVLLPHFPGLAGVAAKHIKQINTLLNVAAHRHTAVVHSNKSAKSKNPRPKSPQRQNTPQPDRRYPFVTTFECKAGGLLVTSP